MAKMYVTFYVYKNKTATTTTTITKAILSLWFSAVLKGLMLLPTFDAVENRLGRFSPNFLVIFLAFFFVFFFVSLLLSTMRFVFYLTTTQMIQSIASVVISNRIPFLNLIFAKIFLFIIGA